VSVAKSVVHHAALAGAMFGGGGPVKHPREMQAGTVRGGNFSIGKLRNFEHQNNKLNLRPTRQLIRTPDLKLLTSNESQPPQRYNPPLDPSMG
jgi:hypothetical protein